MYLPYARNPARLLRKERASRSYVASPLPPRHPGPQPTGEPTLLVNSNDQGWV